jgi:hypothetical protein
MALMSEFVSDESTLLVRYSYKNKPWELYVAPNKEYQLKSDNVFNIRFQRYSWREPGNYFQSAGWNSCK